MSDIIVRAGCFAAIMLIGYFLKKIGLFKQEDFTVLSHITIKITLPGAIIANFGGKQIDSGLLTLIPLAIGCGVLYMSIGYLRNIHRSKEQQAFEMLNLSGYNIGTFVLPFAQSFLGPMGILATGLFDIGNSVICLGGAYSLASMVKEGNGFSLRRLLKALSRSVPFICYAGMLLINLIHIPLPKFVLSLSQIIGNANPFMAMLMIGVGFNLGSDRSRLGDVARILALRYGVGGILAAVFYFCLPFPVEVRQALVILALSPIASANPAFTGEMKCDSGLASAVNSMSVLISIGIIVTLLTIML